MILDATLIKIFTTIQKEIKTKYKAEYSIEEIHSIVEVQIDATKVGISKSVTVVWHRFCKFVFTNKYKRKEDIFALKNTLDTDEDLSQEEKDRIVYNKVIESADKKKKYIADTTNIMDKQSTVESLIKKDNVNNVFIKRFICLTN